jgi:peptidylprolyl isomerase
VNASRALAVLATAALLGFTGCGDKNDSSSDSGSTTADTETTASTDVDTSKKPVVEVPDKPPAGLEIKDLKEGDGPTAKVGDSVSVDYVGVSQSTGKEFDASWNTGQPFTFTIGQQMVIPGWDQGIPGMKVGGRRQLVIPPDLGYGEQGQPPTIAPNETLIFVVDLRGIG